MYIGLFNPGPTRWRPFETATDALNVALDPFGRADHVGAWESPQARLLQAVTFNTPESLRERGPLVCADTGRVLIAWARLDDRPGLAARLGTAPDRLPTITDPELILAAFERWGERCVEHLLGDFSFCLFDPATRSVFCARDPMGVKPLYYHREGDTLVVAAGARLFHALDDLRLAPNESWMAMYAVGRSQSFTESCWRQVDKLAPGHTLRFGAEAALETARYFSFSDDAPWASTRDEGRVEAYRAVLEASVRCRLRTRYGLGTETSGGIDSSTTTGFAARDWQGSPDELHAFGIAVCELEPSYILETSRHHRMLNNHIATGRDPSDVQERLQRSLLLLGHPEEHPDGSGSEPFYRHCEALGLRTLLSGFGGDEAVTNSGNLLLAELADRRCYLTLMGELPGAALLRPARLVKRLVRDRRTGARSPIADALAARWSDMMISESADRCHRVRDRYLRAARYDSEFRRINAFVLGERLGPALTARLESCTLMAAGRGIEYRWPLLDVRLIQQYLSTPSIEKYGRGYGRYLHRRAIEGVVPPKVQWKSGKYMGEPLPAFKRQLVDGGEQLATRFGRLIDSLHPALDPIVDSRKVRDRLPAMRRMAYDAADRAHAVYNRQIGQLESLDCWLKRYHP